MKKLFFVFSLLATLKLQAISLPCFGKVDPEPIPKANGVKHIVPKAAFEINDSSNLDPFTFVASVPTGNSPFFVTYSHSGKFAAVTNGLDDTVSVYRVDCETGEFELLQTVPTGDDPFAIAFSPCDSHAAVANSDGGSAIASITVYSVNCETGEFTLIQTLAPPNNPEIDQPVAITYSPDGRFVAVSNLTVNNNIVIYRVHPLSGKLTLVQIVPLPPGSGPRDLAYSPDGKFLAVVLLLADQGATFTVDPATGKLSNQQIFATGTNPFDVDYSHNGKFAAVANRGGTVTTYTVNQIDGTFTLTDTIVGFTDAEAVAYSRDDRLAAVADTVAGTVTVYCVDQTDGTFEQIQTISGLDGPTSIDFAPCDDFAAVAQLFANLVTVYSVNESACTP